MQKVRGHPYCYRLPQNVGKWFQGLFHSPHRGAFHLSLTVLVHYRSPSVFSLGEWTPQLPTGLACPAVLRCPAGDGRLSHTGLLPSLVGFPIPFRFPSVFLLPFAGSYNPTRLAEWFGLLPFRSPLLRECSLFLWVLRCFSSPGSPPKAYVFSFGMRWVRHRGFPHSDIPGSSPVHGFPGLFAVSHVLLRHLAPRHPP